MITWKRGDVTISYEGGSSGDLHWYEATIRLPRQTDFIKVKWAADDVHTKLEEHRPDIYCPKPVAVIAEDAPNAGAIAILVVMKGWSRRGPCVHLADSNQPSESLLPEPCELCGRYYADD